MPPKAVRPPRGPVLTRAQLSAYDDILTAALVDHVYYWTEIPKNQPSYHAKEEVIEILQEVIANKDISRAEERLLALPSLCNFLSSLTTEKEKDDFKKHLRRYLNIYLPDCPFEVNSTNRYTIVTHEASITARQQIQKHKPVKYLAGIQALLTTKEEEEISSWKKDFSIVVSSRSQRASLFMGPARFINHDCYANACLQPTGRAGIEVVAIRDIDIGEEITVTYSESFFGEDNCECLCKTCEDGLKSGWMPEGGAPAAAQNKEEGTAQRYFLRRHRRRRSGAPTAAPSTKTKSGATKRGHPFATPPFTPSKRRKVIVPSGPLTLEDSTQSELSSCVLSLSPGESPPSTEIRPSETDPATPVLAKLKPEAIRTRTCVPPPTTPNATRPTIEPESDIITEPRGRRFQESTLPPQKRVPGDYNLTPALYCTICSEAFVQRVACSSACPRCERHSTLYGYEWPTTKAGDRCAGRCTGSRKSEARTRRRTGQ